MHELIINITPEGETEFEVKGANGNECLGITKSFEEALGKVDEGDRKFKPEFYEQNYNQNGQYNYGG